MVDLEVCLNTSGNWCTDAPKLISEVEAELLTKTEFLGNLIGPGEATFFVRWERSKLLLVLESVSRRLSIPSGALTLRTSQAPDAGATGKRRGRSPKAFDLWAIPLSNKQLGYLQILDRHPEFNHLVKVFSATGESLLSAEEVLSSNQLFPPVFTFVSWKEVCADNWLWMGNFPVDFEYPMFRHANLSMLYPDRYDDDWALWSSGKGFRLVGRLTEEQKKLEPLMVWPLVDVVERIVTHMSP